MDNIDNSKFYSIYYGYHKYKNSNAPMYVEMCGDEKCSPRYKITRTKSKISVLIYVYKGSGSIYKNNHKFTVKEGDIFTLLEGDTYSYEADFNNPWRILWFNIVGDLYPYLIQTYGIKMISSDITQQKLSLFKNAIELCFEENDDINQILCSKIYEIILSLSKTKTIKSTAQNIKDFIDINIRNIPSNPYNISRISEEFSFSKRHLERLFKDEFNITPYKYFVNEKLKISQKYLENTGLSIKEISEILGFYDQYHFSNLFKTYSGVSPKEFRKNL